MDTLGQALPYTGFRGVTAKNYKAPGFDPEYYWLCLTNARIEAINNKIKLSIRMAYDFRNIDNMIAMIMLRCSDI